MIIGSEKYCISRKLLGKSQVLIKLGNRWHLSLDASWLLVAPILLWAIAIIYIPVIDSGISSSQAWLVSVITLVLVWLSLTIHSLAHTLSAKVFTRQIYVDVFISPLGDPAHFWPAAPSAGKEVLVALAGPLAQGILSYLSYFVWNAQVNPLINVIAFFLIFFNLGILAFNLIPAFPFDGGRIVRSVLWKFLGVPGFANKLSFRLGFVISSGFIICGIVLTTLGHRFSLETGLATIIVGLLITFSLVFRKIWNWDRLQPKVSLGLASKIARCLIFIIIFVPLATLTVSLVPLDNGLEAPGFTVSVEPLVQMPAQYRHTSTGSLILTSVIPQAPILTGEWFYAHLDRSIKLESEGDIVGTGKTVQSTSQESFQMLLDSETVAVVEGMQLAGYTIDMHYDGSTIESILPQSRALGILKLGDIITAVDGKPITSPDDLTTQLNSLNPGLIIELTINRSGNVMNVSVRPVQQTGPVRIGISVTQHSGGITLPFPVKIVSQKISGGPSAGLMFTLGVYDLLSGHNLTGGKNIAGTGTIDLEGNVGPIGGVQQKVVAAERVGAQYFLCPVDNYSDALNAATDITVIKVTTAQDAINFLQSLSR